MAVRGIDHILIAMPAGREGDRIELIEPTNNQCGQM